MATRADPLPRAGRRRLARYDRTERALHWVHAAAFTVLLVSGLCLYLPSLAEAVGRRPLLKAIHVWTAVAWLVALALVLLLGDRGSLRRTLREVEQFDADDRGWFLDKRPPRSACCSPSPASSSGTASATRDSGFRAL
jgi:formate dehydrogenase subunit gamma